MLQMLNPRYDRIHGQVAVHIAEGCKAFREQP